ncbi:hypothetical protein [Salipiger sp.]|uniref:hypothetical protein n=1 Tax=Salipiger sp. TaxID=2078585 RepID=UPI003A97797F
MTAQHMADRLARIRHPGPADPQPSLVVPGRAVRHRVTLRAGQDLLADLARVMEDLGCDCAAVRLDGLRIGPFAHVGPDVSRDGLHAAWYSDTRTGAAARIARGTAIVGRRDGAWFFHCHALWTDGGREVAGHLLPGEVTIADTCDVTAVAFTGGTFTAALNAQTQFTLFHPRPGPPVAAPDALIAKLNPYADVPQTLSRIAREAGFERAEVLGVGSLIGADFTDAPAMVSPISEVLFLPGAATGPGAGLPTLCVDPSGALWQGTLAPGGAPVCVTFEVMLVAL